MWSIGHRRPLAIALCSGLCSCCSCPVCTFLLEFCLSISPPAVVRPASLPLSLQVPGQSLACGAECWLPEGVSDPAPLPLQNLFCYWFLSRSLSQLIWDHLWPSDVADAPQKDVKECLDFLLHCLCRPPSFASVEQDWLHIGVEDVKFGSCPDLIGRPDVLEHDKSCSGLANPDCDISVRTPLSVNCSAKVDERIHFPDGLSTDCDWCVGSGVNLHQLCFLLADLEPCPSWYDLQAGVLFLHLSVVVWQEHQVMSKVEVIQLRPECPLYPVVPACCGGLHDPVDDQKEEKWWQQAPLTDSSLDLEAFWQLAGVSDLAAHVLVGTADEGDDLLRESVVPQQLPQRLSVHTVEGLPIVYEVDVEGGVPLQRLLHYNA